MPDPVIPARPSEFEKGDPISAKLLNDLQTEILRLLVNHDHSGAVGKAQPLTTPAYEDKSVTEPKLADGAITARTVADGAIGTDQIADDAVTGAKIPDGAIGTAHIADDAVTEAKLSPDVRVLLRRTGESASSYSQVIWRDPIVLVPFEPEVSIVDIWRDPQIIDWALTGVVLTEYAEVIEWKFNDDNVIDPSPIDFELGGGKTELIQNVVSEASVRGAIELGEAGAFEMGRGGGFMDAVLGAGISGASGAIDAGVGGFGGGFGGNVGMPQGTLRLLGNAAGAGLAASPDVAARMAANDTAMMMLRSQPRSRGAIADAPAAGAAPPERLAAGLRISAAAEAPASARAAETATPTSGRPAEAAMPTSGRQETKVQLTDTGKLGAARMSSLSAIDVNGRPVAFGSPGSMVVTSGFAGKQTFLPSGEDIDFNDLNTDHERQLASQAAARMLDNLGVDQQYLDATGTKDDFIQMLFNGDPQFWVADGNPYITGTGWLGTVLNWPTLFGTGYAISGGRNILDVTRQTSGGLPVVRVRFITPYRNASYAVCVTPGFNDDFRMITAQVRNKTTSSFEILFGGQTISNGAFAHVNKLSFDLAVFGELLVTA